jgi:hypothetical protein
MDTSPFEDEPALYVVTDILHAPPSHPPYWEDELDRAQMSPSFDHFSPSDYKHHQVVSRSYDGRAMVCASSERLWLFDLEENVWKRRPQPIEVCPAEVERLLVTDALPCPILATAVPEQDLGMPLLFECLEESHFRFEVRPKPLLSAQARG